MNSDPVGDQILAINALSTIGSIACVFPTYFLRLRPEIYRLVLSLAILFGLSTLPLIIFAVFFPLSGWRFDFPIFPIVSFSPLVFVLIAILVCIGHVTRVGLWSTVVLACVIIDWAGIFLLVLGLQ